MGPRPPKPGARALAPHSGAPWLQAAKPVTIEHRALADRARLRAKPDAARQLQDVAAALRDMPRDCATDRAELLLWHSRLARVLDGIALDGLEAVSARVVAPTPRMPFLERRSPGNAGLAERVFGPGSLHRERNHGDQVGTVVSRRGRVARVEVRRRRLVEAGQVEMVL